MKLIPVLTEKSLSEVAKNRYTFFVAPGMTKYAVKKAVEETFGVSVVSVRTMNLKGEKKRTMAGRKRVIMPKKKAVVTLGEKDKIDLFEEVKK